MLRQLLARQRVKKLIKILPGRLYCWIYGHTWNVDIDKPNSSMSVHHELYCAICRQRFAMMDFPYNLYFIRGIANPQYNMALKNWFEDCGILKEHADTLIGKLHTFRSQAIKQIMKPGRVKNVNSVQSGKRSIRISR